jgi:hypothetical protein
MNGSASLAMIGITWMIPMQKIEARRQIRACQTLERSILGADLRLLSALCGNHFRQKMHLSPPLLVFLIRVSINPKLYP